MSFSGDRSKVSLIIISRTGSNMSGRIRRQAVEELVLELLHPAPDGHLDDLEAWAIYFLDEAEDGREHV